MENKASLIFSKIFVVIVSTIFLIIGVKQLYNGIITKGKGDDITLTISHIEKSISTTGSGTHKRTKVDHTVYVNYTYKNQEYTNVRYNIYTSNMKEGGTIQAKINPDNPREFYYSSSNIIIGTIITIISVIVMVTFIFGIKKKS